MATYVRRREFVITLGSAAAWPLAASAQERGRVRHVAVFMAVNADEQGRARVAALTERLQELGWVEGRNIRFDVRWLGSETGRASEYAASTCSGRPARSRSSSFRCRPRSSLGSCRALRGPAA